MRGKLESDSVRGKGYLFLMFALAALIFGIAQQPRPFTGPSIVYPELLRQARLEGRVVTRILVDTSGRVVAESVRVVSSTNAGFDFPVKRAMQTWVLQRVAAPSAPLPATVEVLFLFTSQLDFPTMHFGRVCDHCVQDLSRARDAVRERSRAALICGRLLERWMAVSDPTPLSDTLLGVLQCHDAPVVAPMVIRAMGHTWEGDRGNSITVATMGYRFRTADALLAAAHVAEDPTLPPAGRVYGFQVLSLLVHPSWVWRLDPDAAWNARTNGPERDCDHVMVLSHPPGDWSGVWPIEAEQFAHDVAQRTVAGRDVPGSVRAAAYCLLDLLKG